MHQHRRRTSRLIHATPPLRDLYADGDADLIHDAIHAALPGCIDYVPSTGEFWAEGTVDPCDAFDVVTEIVGAFLPEHPADRWRVATAHMDAA